ncbi:MAG TPA: flagellar export protein FliJ [Gammaproteobacteria bacterium]|nr:flagellar export protein FliJ [Gammaproteobacteria bacterium]
MQPVQHVAASREQSAAQRLGQSQQYLEAQKARLEELCAYRDQYARRFEECGGGGLDAARLRDYRAFLARLGQAIAQQEALIAECRSRHEQTRQHWIASRSHSQAIDKVVERFRQDEQKQVERAEQRDQDERAGRSGHFRR